MPRCSPPKPAPSCFLTTSMATTASSRRCWGCLRCLKAEASRLPESHAAVVEVHEVGLWVEADAASLQCKRQLPQLPGRNSAQAHVDRAAFHVQTVLGDAARSATQGGVRLRRPITANNLERWSVPTHAGL